MTFSYTFDYIFFHSRQALYIFKSYSRLSIISTGWMVHCPPKSATNFWNQKLWVCCLSYKAVRWNFWCFVGLLCMSILGSLFYFDKNKELKFSVNALTNQFVTDCTLMIDKKVNLIVRRQEHQGFNLNEGKFRLCHHKSTRKKSHFQGKDKWSTEHIEFWTDTTLL